MKRFTTLFMLVLLFNCQIQYDISTRYVFEGNVIDRQGNPIQGNDVEAWVYNSNESDFIGYTTTKTDGKFELIIPKPKNDQTKIKIKIKGSSFYNQTEYVNIFQSDFDDYKISFPNITLFEVDDISNLEITLNQINSENTITSIELTGLIPDQINWVNPSEDPIPNQFYSDTYYEQVAKNQTVTLDYEVRNNTGQTESFNESITIGSDDITEYTINF